MTTHEPRESSKAVAGLSFPQSKAFVLQFSAETGPHSGLFQGRVEHVTSGEQADFGSTGELWAFVRAVLVRSVDEWWALPAGRERAA